MFKVFPRMRFKVLIYQKKNIFFWKLPMTFLLYQFLLGPRNEPICFWSFSSSLAFNKSNKTFPLAQGQKRTYVFVSWF